MNTTNYHSHLIISYILTLNSRNGLFIHTPSQMLLEPSLDYLFKFINYQQTLISTPILDYPSEISAQSQPQKPQLLTQHPYKNHNTSISQSLKQKQHNTLHSTAFIIQTIQRYLIPTVHIHLKFKQHIYYKYITVSKTMTSHFKVRPKIEQPTVSKILKYTKNQEERTRRIHTEAYQHLKDTHQHIKKINLYPSKPLVESKQNNNIPSKNMSSTSKINYSQSSLKTSSKIKSILIAETKKSKDKIRNLLTQPSERFKTKLQSKKIETLFDKKINFSKQKSTVLKQVTGLQKYTLDQQVGSGTFGVVYKGRNKTTLEVVAIKKVFQDKKYKNREGEILKLLNHYNVLKMKDSFFTQQKKGEYLNVVMDYFPDTAYSFIRKHSRKNPIPPALIKIYAYQLFRSLLYLNKIEICHRDIKPHNILVDQHTNKLVMCDFGSAKKLVKGQPNIAYICSRCYRAPELIFGATGYTTQIDMWSAGCVIAQMLTFEPLFMASNNIDQLVEIIKLLGTPSQQQVLAMNPEYDMDQFRFPQIAARDWKKIIKDKADPQLMDVLKGVLKYNPEERLSPFKALCHPYFDQLRNEKSYYRLKREFSIPELFNFSLQECSSQQLSLLMPSWARE